MPDPGGNPFEQYQLNSGQDLRAQSMQMRMMMNADRMGQMGMPRTRYAGARGGQQGINPMLGAMAGNSGDYSAFTYDPTLNAQAQAAGVTPLRPDQVNPNAIFPNSGFFGRHPRLTSMLEGGIFGAAATRGSDTIGEGISNVASGLLEGRMAKQGIVNRQFQQPFNSANMLESLQDKIALRKYRDSEQQHLDAENARYAHDKSFSPIPANASSIMQFNPSTGQYEQKENPFYDPKTANSPASDLDDKKQAFASWNDEFRNKNKRAPSSSEIEGFERTWRNSSQQKTPTPQQELWKHADGTIFELKSGYKVQPGDQALKPTEGQPNRDAAARTKFIEGVIKRPSGAFGITGKVYDMQKPGEAAQAAKDIGKYYDENLAPNNSPMPQSKIPTFNPATGQLE